MKKGFIIAIDGPVASGKGTIAASLAQKIGAINFNSGGVWRAYTYYLMQHSIGPEDDFLSQLQSEMANISIHDDGSFDILLNGVVVSEQLLDPEISKTVPLFGLHREFAEFIISELKRIANSSIQNGHIVIMEGRQIGTDVFPDAEMKIFLTASLEERSKRRFLQYQSRGVSKTVEEVQSETRQRDEQDMSREFGALVRNPEDRGYFILDDTSMSENDTLSVIIEQLKEKQLI